MLLVNRKTGSIDHFSVRDLPQLLAAGDTIVVNDSKVINARLVGFRTLTGGRWEGLFLREGEQGIGELLCKTRGRMEIGETVTLRDREGRDQGKLVLLATGEEGRMFLGRIHKNHGKIFWNGRAECRFLPTSAMARWSITIASVIKRCMLVLLGQSQLPPLVCISLQN